MRNPFKPGTDQAFFWRHGGYSFDPLTETPEQGRKRCAINSADDESRGRAAGFSFEWQIDSDIDSSEWDDSPDPWSTWNCVCHDSSGRVVSSLSGIDFGRNGEPWGDPYRRVVEADLASDALIEIEAKE